VLAAASAARLLRAGRPSAPQKVLLAFAVVLAWSVVRGADVNGINAAVNEARKYLTFTAATLYFSTVEPRREVFDRIARMWLWAAFALAGLTLLRWVANAAGVTGGLFGSGTSMRVIPSAAALVLAQGALLGLPALRDWREGWLRYITPTLVVFALLLQHRTVWVITAGAALYLLFRAGALEPRVLGALSAGLAVFAVLALTLFNDVDDGVAAQLQSSATTTNTFEWRVAGWQVLIEDAGPEGIEVVTGSPFGGGWERVLDGNVVDVSPHNFYLETYLRMGFAGVVGLLALYALALRGARRTSALDGFLARDVLTAMVVMQLGYYITYTPNGAQAILLGLACAAATAAAERNVPAPAHPVIEVPR
jgi:hypothetical protein